MVSIATADDLLRWHPHGHVLVTDGGFAEDGAFRPVASQDSEALMRLFRERLLTRHVEKYAISQELARKQLLWRHPGFSAHVREPIAPENAQAIEDMAGYVTRNPLSLERLVCVDGRQAVIYKALKPNPIRSPAASAGESRGLSPIFTTEQPSSRSSTSAEANDYRLCAVSAR